MDLPDLVLSKVFKNLKQIDLIEASAVCKKWRNVIWSKDFCLKIGEVNKLFLDKHWLLKTYEKHFEGFKDDVYWNCICILPDRRLAQIETEIFQRMFYAILPFHVQLHLWFCSRSQEDRHICQFCTMLRIQNVKINDYIRKNFCIKTRLFPMLLRHSILYAPDIRLFVSIRSGRDRQRPYCEHNFGVLYYEGISSLFLLFKFYLDILGRINFNLRDKHLLPIMLNNQYLLARKNYSARKKFKEDIYIFTVKLIKRLVVSTCQVVNPHMFPHVFENYKVGVNCYNPYLSIDRHR